MLPIKFNRIRSIQLDSVKANVILTFSLIALIMIGTSIATYMLISKLQDSNLRESFRELQKNVMDIKLSSHEFILKDRNNLFYFADGKSENIEHYREALKKYHQSYSNVKTQLHENGFGETDELDVLDEKVKEYNYIFGEIELGIKKRGIDSYGIIGDFDIALDKIARFDYGSDNISILRLKYFIQEYQLNGSKNTIQRVTDETYIFSNQLEKYISDRQVVMVIYALSDYESNFKKLVTIDSTLGLYSKGGLQAKLFGKTNEIDKILPLVKTNEQISSAYSDIVRNTMISLAVATLLLGFLIIKFRERDLRNDTRRLEASVLARTLEIYNKNEEIRAQADEIKTINQNLEQLVKERTKQLEKKNKALEDYAFITAHNLRAPLASILGLVNLITKIKLSEEEKIMLEHLQLSAEKLDAIVHTITEAIEQADETPQLESS
jgi:hypothetical protein